MSTHISPNDHLTMVTVSLHRLQKLEQDAAELVRLRAEHEALKAFVNSFDIWGDSPEMLGGELFDAMMDKRQELEEKYGI